MKQDKENVPCPLKRALGNTWSRELLSRMENSMENKMKHEMETGFV